MVAPDGQPTQVRFDRWSNANPEKLHPFLLLKQLQLFTDHYIDNIRTNGYAYVIMEDIYDYIW